MNYIRVPKSISSRDFEAKQYSFSSSLYKTINISNSKSRVVKDLLDSCTPYDKGFEPGSLWYMSDSPYKFIRTKALQAYTSILYPKGNSIIGINPRAFVQSYLKAGDILLSKDSNVGECAILTADRAEKHMFSGGIVRLNVKNCDSYYLFSFLKHPLFKQQLECRVPRGATIKHAKDLWLDCLIPFPHDESLVDKVSIITRVIVLIDQEIEIKANQISSIIDTELDNNQLNNAFYYSYPHIKEIRQSCRLDAAIYSQNYKSTIWKVENYSNGFLTPKSDGFSVIPGPSLEIKLLKVRIDSETYRDGYYSLILPANISEYGTMNVIPYIGTPKRLPTLKYGDVIFGEAGFQKGRSIVLLDESETRLYTTNAHGLYARRNDNNIIESIFFRCIFDWYRKNGLIDLMAVGGSGGHFSPEYFESIKIPSFPDSKKRVIARIYHNNAQLPELDNWESPGFFSSCEKVIKEMGIWELNESKLNLSSVLRDIQSQIIDEQ